MSADVAAGWALSRSQWVSVVPMIQCRPQGMTKRTDFSVRRMMPERGVDPVAGHDEVDALGGPDVELAALADHRLGVVGPDAGRVDDLPGVDVELAAGHLVERPDPGDALALAEEPDRRDAIATCAP